MGANINSARFRTPGTLIASLAAAVLLSLAVSGCSGGQDDSAVPALQTGNVRPVSVSAPSQAHRGEDIPVTFEVSAGANKYNVQAGLELVPFDPETDSFDAIEPFSAGYVSYEVSGETIPFLRGGDLARIDAVMNVSASVPAGTYAVVLVLNRRDNTPDDDHLQAESDADRADNFVVSTQTIEVVAPSLSNLHVLAFEPSEFSFELADHNQPLLAPGAADLPDSGDQEDEADIKANLLVEAQFFNVASPVDVTFELGIPDALNVVQYFPLKVIVRGGNAPGTALANQVTFGVDTLTGVSFEVVGTEASPSGTTSGPGAIRGSNVELQLTPAARDALLLLTGDTKLTLRANIDSGNAQTEEDETDNGVSVDIMFINDSALPEADLGGAAPFNWSSNGDDGRDTNTSGASTRSDDSRDSQTSSVLKGDRLLWWNTYPYVLFSYPKTEEWGWRDKIALGYLIGTTISYDGRKLPKPQIADGDTIHLALNQNSFVQASEGGGRGAGGWAGVSLGWESFALEQVARNGSSYTVRFKCNNGTNYLRRNPLNDMLDAVAAVTGADTDFTLVDTNGGELLSGDKIQIQHTGGAKLWNSPGRPCVFSAATPSTFQLPSAKDSFTVLKTGTAAVKGKFYADGWANLWVLDNQVQIVSAAAAAEVDAEDIIGSYFEWEVRVFGEKVFGEFRGIEGDSATGLVKKTLFDAGTKYTKSKEKKVSTKIWVGPVPIDLEVGGKGSLGIKGKVEIQSNNRLVAETGPFVKFSGFAGARLDLLVASVGVRGEITIIELTAKFKAELQLFANGSNAKLTLKGPIELKTMGGRIYVFVTWDFVFTSGKKEWDIAKWDGWTGNWDWFTPVVYQWPA